MNIQFQLCGLFILILLFIFYKSHKTLQLYKERLFYHALCIIITSLLLDILSLVAIKYQMVLPTILVDFICKSYVITLIWGAWSAFEYVLTDVFSEREHVRMTYRLTLMTGIESLIVYILPIYIYLQIVRWHIRMDRQ